MSHSVRSTRARRKLQRCTLGQDFGSSSSKLALCWSKGETWTGEDGQTDTEWRPHLSRVPLQADLDNPERDNRADANQYEFPAFAAVSARAHEIEGDDSIAMMGEIKTGRVALQEDVAIPLKTIFVWRAGIQSKAVLRRLPGGKDLLRAIFLRQIDTKAMDEAARAHFRLLRQMAMEEAETSNVEIRTIVISFPHYLCERKHEIDPEKRFYNLSKYLDHYIRLILEVWEGHPYPLRIEVIGEGQAAALYVCEGTTHDNVLKRRRIWDQFKDLITCNDGEGSASWLPLLIADNGSSSLGFHVQTVYFDSEDSVESSQSQHRPEWLEGTTGGSHLTNERVKDVIRVQLESQPVRPGHIAELLAHYESAKTNLDYTDLRETLVLQAGSDEDRVEVFLFPSVLESIFREVFGEGLTLLDSEIEALIDGGHDFAVLFCGGSYVNRGLRHQAKQRISHYQTVAAEKGVTIKYEFLANADAYPTMAVACGAALSAMRVPPVNQLLRGSALGIQVLQRVDMEEVAQGYDHVLQWDKEVYADFLFSKGCVVPPYIDYDIRESAAGSLRFQLVCDPNYYPCRHGGPRQLTRRPPRIRKAVAGLASARGTTTKFPRLSIGTPPAHINGPQETYDLDFVVDAADLPRGMVCFRMLGRAVDRLMQPTAWDEDQDDKTTEMYIELRCTKINRSRKEVADARNKRWLLNLKTDYGSKLLTLPPATHIPFKCVGCEGTLQKEIYICQECRDVGFCVECYEDEAVGADHDPSHSFNTITWDI